MDHPYSDAGVLDTGALLQDPLYSPKGVWLGSPMGTIFGTAVNGNASAVILLINVSFNGTLPQTVSAITAVSANSIGCGRSTHIKHHLLNQDFSEASLQALVMNPPKRYVAMQWCYLPIDKGICQ